MRVLLINPNRYKTPPVPPIGLEYLAASLEARGHLTEILDLCFSEDAHKSIDDMVTSFIPDIVGITVRNVDSALYHTNEFFLDEIKEIIRYIKTVHRLRVMIGGAGVSANPEAALDYLNADVAIAGPAEHIVHKVLQKIRTSGHTAGIYHGRYAGEISCLRKSAGIDYRKYCESGGVVGFETHKGCSSSCVFCLEANTRVSFKKPEDVVHEIRSFVDKGHNHFHVCDSEFNEDLEYAVHFCTALKKAGMDIKWALYMKPVNFNKNLFKLLKDTGVYLITLSMDSWKKCDLYWSDYEKFIFGAKSCGIKIAVDFLTGFPHENELALTEHFDNLRRPLPDSIGINTYIRLYKSLRITDIILKDISLRDYLLGYTEVDPGNWTVV